MLNKWFIFRFNWGDTLGCDFKRCLRKSSLLLDDLLRRRAWRRPWRVCGQQRRRPTIFRVRIQWQLMSDYSSSHGSGSSSNTSASSDSGGLGSAHSDAVSGIATVVGIGTTASSNASRAVISTAATSSRWAWAVVRVASWLASWKWTIITIPGVSLMKNSRTILSQKETYVLQADHWNFLIMI